MGSFWPIQVGLWRSHGLMPMAGSLTSFRGPPLSSRHGAALDALNETDPLVMQVELRGCLLYVTMTID
jgi:hypothetical protein